MCPVSVLVLVQINYLIYLWGFFLCRLSLLWDAGYGVWAHSWLSDYCVYSSWSKLDSRKCSPHNKPFRLGAATNYSSIYKRMASDRPWWRKKSEGHNCPRRQAPRKQSIHEKIQNWLQQQWIRLENDHGFQQEKDKGKEESSALKKKFALNFYTSISDLRKGTQLGWSQAGLLGQQPGRDAVGTIPCLRAGAGLRTLASPCGKGLVYSTASSDLVSDKGGVPLWRLGYCKIPCRGSMQHCQKSSFLCSFSTDTEWTYLRRWITFLVLLFCLSCRLRMVLFNSKGYLMDFWTAYRLLWELHRLSVTISSKWLRNKVTEFLTCYPIPSEKYYCTVTSETSWRLLGKKGQVVHRFKQKLQDVYRGGPNELLG